MDLAANLELIRQRIKTTCDRSDWRFELGHIAGRHKTQPPETVNAAAGLGLRCVR